MPTPLLDLYEAIAGEVPPAIASPPALAALGRIVAQIPHHAETFGFEIRLAGEGDTVDLGIGLSLATGGDRFLAEPAADVALRRAVTLDSRWRRLHEFGRAWSTNPAWRARVPFLFLEIDGDAAPWPVPVPSVFVGLDWPLDELSADARRRGREVDATQTPGFADIEQMVATLRREPVDVRTRAMLARCLATIPDGGLVLHVAVMLGRPHEAVRLSLLLPRGKAVELLGSLGWIAGGASLAAALGFEAAASGANHPLDLVQIDVDVGAELGAAVGLMLQPRAGSWPRLLSALHEAELCDAARREALLAWAGVGLVGGVAVERYLAHAKVVCGAGIAPRAKAYVGFRSSTRDVTA